MARFVSRNPATGEVIAEHEGWSREVLRQRVLRAHAAWERWRTLPAHARASRLAALAGVLESRADEAARTMTEEMGKPVREARAEVAKCARACRELARRAPGWLAPRRVDEPDLRALVVCEPLGVILGVMPWNFPFWQVVRFAAPLVAAGGGAVIKHAPGVGLCARLLDEIFQEVFGELVQVGLFDEALVAEALGWDEIRGASLTGSVPAGRAVAGAAGRFGKPCVLELGGSDPYLVLEDADLELAARSCVNARMINSGQTCIAAKRWIVVEAVHDRFVALATEAMRALRTGDPRREDTDIGPLARADLRDRLTQQVEASLAAGARLLFRGEAPEAGFFFPPTLLGEVRPGMPAFEEELFGPVACVVRARDEAEAIRLANASPFGLGAGVFSGDEGRALRIAHELAAGNVGVNRFVVSDPRVPFGGVRASGFGRELGPEGVRAFVNVKTILLP